MDETFSYEQPKRKGANLERAQVHAFYYLYSLSVLFFTYSKIQKASCVNFCIACLFVWNVLIWNSVDSTQSQIYVEFDKISQ